jgi:intergrase/recombinase
LPLKVNKPQKGPDVAGVWLLGWYQVHVKYKNGKKLAFWVHTDNHYDANDKIDITVQYIDRAPINKALGMH